MNRATRKRDRESFKPSGDLEPLPPTDRGIPIRGSELVGRLLLDPRWSVDEKRQFDQMQVLLGAQYHHMFHHWLRELQNLYQPIDPDSAAVQGRKVDTTLADLHDGPFLEVLDRILRDGNFRELPRGVIEQAITSPNEMGLNYQPDLGQFVHLRVYVRGNVWITRRVRSFQTRFRKRDVLLPGYSRLVLVLRFRAGREYDRFVRSDVVYLRYFRDVPHVDMEMHLPEQATRVRMRLIDKAQIASPLMTGIPMVAFKVLVGSLSPWAIPALVAPVTAGVNSFFGFRRAQQRHLHHMIRHLYYLTLANNAAVLTSLIDEAESEEFKESLLAYAVLWLSRRADGGLTAVELDGEVEQWLAADSGIRADFDIHDAIEKLERFGLVRGTGERRYTAVPLSEAIARLNRLWDSWFHPSPTWSGGRGSGMAGDAGKGPEMPGEVAQSTSGPA
jgi:hypothetical protein